MKESLRTLIVDDSEDDARLIVHELRRGGYNVDWERVETAQALRKALANGTWDLILCDFSFPHFSGEEALCIAKELGRDKPFIYVSGRMGEETAVQAMKAGAHDYIMKDNLTRLLPSIERELRESRERRRTEEAMRVSELQLRTFIDNTAALIYAKDLDGRYLMVNRQIENAFRLSREEICRRTDLEIFPKSEAEMLRKNDREVVAAGRPLEWEERFEQPDGVHTYLSVKFPLRLPSGEVYAIGGVSTDITDRKRVAEELARQKEALENANRAKDRFLAMLSHELRTPLTPIQAGIEVLQEDLEQFGPEVVAKLAPTLRMMHQNIQLERRLIDDLLHITRLAAGKIDLHMEPVDVHSAIQDALSICRVDAESQGIAIHLDLKAAEHFVKADPARLRQVIWNLIQNAAKYTPRGGDVFLSTFNTPSGELIMECRDTGIGIDPEFLQHIFTPFEQGSRNPIHSTGGIGLGLAISKGLMEMHGGTLTVESAGLNKGSTFRISLKTVPEPSTAPAPTPPPPPAPPRKPSKQTHILLVEDNDDTRNILSRLLTSRGYSVCSAHDAPSALKAVTGNSFDLVISDIGLPNISGFDLMRQIQEKTPMKGIAISGFGCDTDIEKSKDAGFAKHLIKPLDFKELEAAIQELVSCE